MGGDLPTRGVGRKAQSIIQAINQAKGGKAGRGIIYPVVLMPGDPHEVMRKVDQKLLEEVEGARRFAFSEGAIPVKYKLLIAMAIDASHGASGGRGHSRKRR